MKELDFQEIININYRILTLLGIATEIINNIHNKPEKVKWFNDAIERVIYLNKPIPDMP